MQEKTTKPSIKMEKSQKKITNHKTRTYETGVKDLEKEIEREEKNERSNKIFEAEERERRKKLKEVVRQG